MCRGCVRARARVSERVGWALEVRVMGLHRMHVYVRVHVYAYVHVYVSVHVYVHVCVCACVCATGHGS